MPISQTVRRYKKVVPLKNLETTYLEWLGGEIKNCMEDVSVV